MSQEDKRLLSESTGRLRYNISLTKIQATIYVRDPLETQRRTETKSANQRRPTPNSEPDLGCRRTSAADGAKYSMGARRTNSNEIADVN